MADLFTILYGGVILFGLVVGGSYVRTMLALRSFHEDTPPSVSAAVDLIQPGGRNRD